MLHRRHLPIIIGLLVSGGVVCAEAADLRDELRAAMEQTTPVTEKLEPLLRQGRVAEANEQLLAVFPQAKRTPAQALVLGNILYGIDPKLSYALHRDANKGLPEEPAVVMEWAMEQHRAGEWAGALAGYDLYAKANPDFAPVHGLAAECLVRLGRLGEAAARWERSEQARNGKLEDFETMVGEVHRDFGALDRRIALRAQVQKGDVDAAVNLIVLDCDYPFDWWNGGTHRGFLTADLPLLDGVPVSKRIDALRCLAASALLDGEDATEAERRKPLLDHALIIDGAHTLPADPAVASLLISHAMVGKLMTQAEAKGWFLEALLAQAQTSHDATLWNLVAALLAGDDRMQAVEKQGWKATGDVRFAVGYLTERQSHGDVPPNDPELLAAVAQFPESAELAHVQITCVGKPDAALLARAITAEYHHFSSFNPPGFVPRPGAWMLRSYFTTLAELKP